MNEERNIDKLLGHLDQEISADNDEMNLNHLGDILGEFDHSFSSGFSNAVSSELFPQDMFSGRIVQMFKRVAISSAAAIILMMTYNGYQAGQFDGETLFGISQIEEAAYALGADVYNNY